MISTWGQFQEEKIWGPGLPLPLVEVRLKSNKATAAWKGIWRNLRRQNPEVFVFEVFLPQLPILDGIVPSVCSVKLCKLYMVCTLVQLDTHYVEWLHLLGIWLHLFERRLVVEAHLRFIAIASWWYHKMTKSQIGIFVRRVARCCLRLLIGRWPAKSNNLEQSDGQAKSAMKLRTIIVPLAVFKKF